jgi:hypothetical protein
VTRWKAIASLLSLEDLGFQRSVTIPNWRAMIAEFEAQRLAA